MGEDVLVYFVKEKKFIGLLIVMKFTGRMIPRKTLDGRKRPDIKTFQAQLSHY